MASAGQILGILNKLGKGLKKTQRQERGSRVKEAKQHKKQFLNLGAELEKAAGKGKKWSNLGNTLSMLAGLTGVGMPAVLALQLVGGLAGGHLGAKQSRDYAKGIKGFKGSKFGREIETYKSEVGTDVGARALGDTMITALSMGAGKTLGAGVRDIAGDMGKLMSSLGKTKLPGNIFPKLEGKTLSEIIKLPTGLKEQLKGIKLPKDFKELFTKGQRGADIQLGFKPSQSILEKIIGSASEKSPEILERTLGTMYGQYQKKQQPSILEYEVPESLSRPSGFGGYY